MLFIFDMGGVVSGNVHTIPAMTGRLGIGEATFFAICSVPEGTPQLEKYDHGLLAAHQSGAITSVRFWQLFRSNAEALLADDEAAVMRIESVTSGENLWETCFRPETIQGTVDIARELKARGHRVVCGTNTLDAHYRIHESLGHYEIFDRVYASHLLGVTKPNREFWLKILAAEKTDPARAIFIDDNETNVRASRAVGVRGITFVSAGDLAKDLAEYLSGAAAKTLNR